MPLISNPSTSPFQLESVAKGCLKLNVALFGLPLCAQYIDISTCIVTQDDTHFGLVDYIRARGSLKDHVEE